VADSPIVDELHEHTSRAVVNAMAGVDYLDRLKQRRDYLTHRIQAKINVGWNKDYDTDERDALTWAIAELERKGHA
jgi:hypothetical protein